MKGKFPAEWCHKVTVGQLHILCDLGKTSHFAVATESVSKPHFPLSVVKNSTFFSSMVVQYKKNIMCEFPWEAVTHTFWMRCSVTLMNDVSWMGWICRSDNTAQFPMFALMKTTRLLHLTVTGMGLWNTNSMIKCTAIYMKHHTLSSLLAVHFKCKKDRSSSQLWTDFTQILSTVSTECIYCICHAILVH